MKGNLVVRLMAVMVVLPILIAHFVGQVDLLSPTWLWVSLFAGVMGLQATYTGFCPASLVAKFSKTGECCPGGSCGTKAKQDKQACCGDDASNNTAGCCGGEKNDAVNNESTVKTNAPLDASQHYHILILGTGCVNCANTYAQVEKVTGALGLNVTLEKVEDIAEIAKYGVMATPGVVINGQVVHAGGVPTVRLIDSWFSAK